MSNVANSKDDIPALSYRNITLRIEDRQINLRIARDEASEELMRNACTRVNNLFSQYKLHYPDAKSDELMMYVSLHLASQVEANLISKEKVQLDRRIKKLLSRIDEVLE